MRGFLKQGISESVFYGDLVSKFKLIVGTPSFTDKLETVAKPYKVGI